MRPVKSIFGVIAALLPIAYCGGLVWYFSGFRGATEGSFADGLGPTILGLGAIGLLFCIPLVLKIVRAVSKPRAPVPDGEGEGPAESGFDADAALARYMARRAVEGAPAMPRDAGPRTPFGRRVV